MKLYRYLKEEELKKIQSGEIESIGFFYNDKEKYKKSNNHNYELDTKYLHFFLKEKDISRIKELKFTGDSLFYICEFNVPFYIILPHIGYGIYHSNRGWFNNSTEKVYEVALPSKKMDKKYLIKYTQDKQYPYYKEKNESLEDFVEMQN